ncbi:MAG TPA: SURF1 family cytochrome oxidase biogenesis protein [Sphingomonas sp.]|nr:SURF1 family cytochrome oxidase biogenesis protein [Sphingomonas sp.]
MTRVPVLPTIFVVLCVAVMIALGWWQLRVRLPQKEAQLAQLAANPARPPIAFPLTPDQSLLFRRTSLDCAKVESIDRNGAGGAGFRLIANCRTRAAGPPVKVQLGTTRDPMKTVTWAGGVVSGWISHAPDATPLGTRLFSQPPRELLLVADRPVAGLSPNTRPDIGLVPNNHLAYAGQWFFFAAVAAVIYALALRRRWRG